jgi:hypothetical protein
MDVKDFNAEASAVRSVAVPPGLLMQGGAGVQSAAGGKRFEALARADLLLRPNRCGRQ